MKKQITALMIAAAMIFTPAAIAGAAAEEETAQAAAWTPQQVRYAFEHNMMPKYFYDDPENMLSTLQRVAFYDLWESVARENGVDPTYPEEDYVAEFYDYEDGTVLAQIELPEPDDNLLCHRIYFLYNPDTGLAGYYTTESDSFMTDTSFLCTWTEDHSHAILGSVGNLDREAADYEEGLKAERDLVLQAAGLGAMEEKYDPGTEKTETPEPEPEPEPGPEGPEELPGPEYTGLAEIACPEMGFTTMADPAYAWDYDEGTGISIYTENEGTIPYVTIFRSEDLLMEPFEFIKEQYTPHMKEKYGEDLVSAEEIEEIEIGGRMMAAGVYTYRLQEYLIDTVRAYDSSGDRTVIFSAKYIQGEGDATLDALDTAAAYFKTE